MNHLPLIIKREYMAKVKNKSFILMTFLTPFIIIGLSLFIGYLSSINNDTVRSIYVLDDTGFVSETFKTTDYTIYNHLSEVDLETAKILSNQENAYGLLHIPKCQLRPYRISLNFIQKNRLLFRLYLLWNQKLKLNCPS